MLVSNEILNSFLNCQYKAYPKSRHKLGNTPEYHKLYNQLKQHQKKRFEKTLSGNKKLFLTDALLSNSLQKEGIGLNVKCANEKY